MGLRLGLAELDGAVMTPIEEFFGHIIVINLGRRADRWKHARDQFEKQGIENYYRFEAIEGTTENGGFNGNLGCTSSHRAVLDLIIKRGWEKCLVVEDDNKFVYPDAQGRFEEMAPQVPSTWDMLYLGGHYGENPIARVGPNVIRMGRMLTTSSYGVTLKMAKILAPHVTGIGPIDSIYGAFHRERECYILDPRLCVQYTNFSDLQHREMDNSQCMLDPVHAATV